MAVANGTFLKVEIGTAVLVGETSHSFSSDANMIATSNKETGRSSTFVAGRTTRTIEFSSMYDPLEDTAYNFHDILAAQDAGTIIAWTLVNVDALGVDVPTSHKFTGSGLFSGCTQDNPDDDVSSFSGTIQVTGDIVASVVAGS